MNPGAQSPNNSRLDTRTTHTCERGKREASTYAPPPPPSRCKLTERLAGIDLDSYRRRAQERTEEARRQAGRTPFKTCARRKQAASQPALSSSSSSDGFPAATLYAPSLVLLYMVDQQDFALEMETIIR